MTSRSTQKQACNTNGIVPSSQQRIFNLIIFCNKTVMFVFVSLRMENQPCCHVQWCRQQENAWVGPSWSLSWKVRIHTQNASQSQNASIRKLLRHKMNKLPPLKNWVCLIFIKALCSWCACTLDISYATIIHSCDSLEKAARKKFIYVETSAEG